MNPQNSVKENDQEAGNPGGGEEDINVTFEDIIERERTPEETKEWTRTGKEVTDAALDALMDTFFLFEAATGTALRWNRAFRDISGYTDEEIAGMPAPESYYSPEDIKRATVFIGNVLKEGTGTIEMELIRKDGLFVDDAGINPPVPIH